MASNMRSLFINILLLAIIIRSKKGIYGYEIHRKTIDLELSESAIYQALYCLERNNCLIVDNELSDGRNRKLYKISEEGINKFEELKIEWEKLKVNIDTMLSCI